MEKLSYEFFFICLAFTSLIVLAHTYIQKFICIWKNNSRVAESAVSKLTTEAPLSAPPLVLDVIVVEVATSS